MKQLKQWIEKHSVYIGIGLIVLILIGGVLLMVKKGAWASGDSLPSADEKDQKIIELENRISDLEAKIAAQNSQPSTATNPPAGGEATASPSPNSNQSAGKININSATAAQLDSLPGIGPTYAQRIIDYRSANGPFTSTDKIQDVKGIGPKTFEKFKDQITI